MLFCSCVFSVLLALRLPRLGNRELVLVLFVRLLDLRLFDLSVSSASRGLGRAAARGLSGLLSYLFRWRTSQGTLLSNLV